MTSVGYSTEDRQWDVRINVQTDDYLVAITENIMMEAAAGKFKYVLIGGLEIGTKPLHSDYQIRHVHVAVIFNNRCSKSAIIKNWGIVEGNGYYMVPRNRNLPYSGWREHHIKDFSKVDKEKTIIYESGKLPDDPKQKLTTARSEEEKKRKVDEILIEMREMIKDGQEEQAFKKFPRNYVLYGSRLKAMIHQKADFFGTKGDPHIYLYGYPGTGKTQILKYVYPNMYKKDLSNRFFDLYDPTIHTHVMLEDLDYENVEKLGIQFLKTLCDEAGFPIDQKYKTPQLTRSTILVTSNFSIPEIIPEDIKGVEQTKAALFRRFWHIRIDCILRILGLKLIDKWERNKLKAEGNEEPGRVFMTWDYAQDIPAGLPIKKPEEYQEMLRNEYYKQ